MTQSDNRTEAVAIISRYDGRLVDLAAQSEFWSTGMLYRVLRGDYLSRNPLRIPKLEVEDNMLVDLKRADDLVISQSQKSLPRMGKTGLPMKSEDVVDYPTVGDTVIDEETGVCGWCIEPDPEVLARFLLEDGVTISTRESCTSDGLFKMSEGRERDGYGLVPVCDLPLGRRAWKLTRKWRTEGC